MALNAIEMTVGEWIKIADNPRQRNTEARAKLALENHLKELAKPHAFVDAARLRGQLYKLNGHTRAFVWEHKLLKRPLSLTVNIVEAKTMEEVKELYDMYDSKWAVKKPKDTLYGACSEIGLDMTSRLLKTYEFSTQLTRAADDFESSMYKLVAEWRKEIKALDDLNLSRRYPFIVGEALRLLRSNHNHDKIGEFFHLIDQDKEVKDSRGRDGVQMAIEFFAKKKAAKATGGWDNWDDFDAEIRRAFNQWTDHRLNKTPRRLRPVKKDCTIKKELRA